MNFREVTPVVIGMLFGAMLYASIEKHRSNTDHQPQLPSPDASGEVNRAWTEGVQHGARQVAARCGDLKMQFNPTINVKELNYEHPSSQNR